MITPAFFTVALLLTVCACALWYISCLHESVYTRSSILDLLCDKCPGIERVGLIDDFDRVTLRSHVRAVLTLRDPLALYSNNIRKLLHKEAGRDYS
jgi:hypothetical protein